MKERGTKRKWKIAAILGFGAVGLLFGGFALLDTLDLFAMVLLLSAFAAWEAFCLYCWLHPS
jgi:hypothetical protein